MGNSQRLAPTAQNRATHPQKQRAASCSPQESDSACFAATLSPPLLVLADGLYSYSRRRRSLVERQPLLQLQLPRNAGSSRAARWSRLMRTRPRQEPTSRPSSFLCTPLSPWPSRLHSTLSEVTSSPTTISDVSPSTRRTPASPNPGRTGR